MMVAQQSCINLEASGTLLRIQSALICCNLPALDGMLCQAGKGRLAAAAVPGLLQMQPLLDAQAQHSPMHHTALAISRLSCRRLARRVMGKSAPPDSLYSCMATLLHGDPVQEPLHAVGLKIDAAVK